MTLRSHLPWRWIFSSHFRNLKFLALGDLLSERPFYDLHLRFFYKFCWFLLELSLILEHSLDRFVQIMIRATLNTGSYIFLSNDIAISAVLECIEFFFRVDWIYRYYRYFGVLRCAFFACTGEFSDLVVDKILIFWSCDLFKVIFLVLQHFYEK